MVNGYKCYCPLGYTGPDCQEHTRSDPVVTQLPPEHNQHMKTLYVVSGCLGTAFIIVIVTMVICVCRLQTPGGGYDYYTDMSTPIKSNKSKKGHGSENPKLSVDLTSLSQPRPSVQAIYEVTTVDYKTDPNEPLVASLKPKSV
ncbi:uncharacterized protein LOC102804478 [Saccoglossus kowalevskii]|uniref:Delta and Notch-like epidermal growth factor-related receptor-like n=1 Tax=Saccoglossus kowalevskii TaxID=10224 RepID=A0ABM0M9G3_SACKO|nr:PREDICTED: delta and Notch-like epidermal growth factor-related receptor-like [Saccoglossus kowalevskii]